jgi:hypothetical protein
LKSLFDVNNSYISKLKQDKKFDLEGELTPQETPSMFHLALALVIIPLTFSSLKFFNSDSNLEISSSCVPPF